MNISKALCVLVLLYATSNFIIAQSQDEFISKSISPNFFSNPQQLDILSSDLLIYSGIHDRAGNESILYIDRSNLSVRSDLTSHQRYGRYVIENNGQISTATQIISTDYRDETIVSNMFDPFTLGTGNEEYARISPFEIFCSQTQQFPVTENYLHRDSTHLLHLNHVLHYDDTNKVTAIIRWTSTLENAVVSLLSKRFDHSILINNQAYIASENQLFSLDSTHTPILQLSDSIVQLFTLDDQVGIVTIHEILLFDPKTMSLVNFAESITSKSSSLLHIKIHSDGQYMISSLDDEGNLLFIHSDLREIQIPQGLPTINPSKIVYEFDDTSLYIVSPEFLGHTHIHKIPFNIGVVPSPPLHDIEFVGYMIDSVRNAYYLDEDEVKDYGFYYRLNIVVANNGTDTLDEFTFHAKWKMSCPAFTPVHRIAQRIDCNIAPGEIDTLTTTELRETHPKLPADNFEACFLITNPNGQFEQDTSNNSICARSIVTNIDEIPMMDPGNLFPNPAINFIYFSDPEGIQTVQIFTPQGQLILMQLMQSHDHIEVSHVPNGIYFLQFLMKGGSKITKKVVIN